MKRTKITDIQHLTDSTYIVRMERNGMEFYTGQFVILKRPHIVDQREYTIYSGEKDDYLDVLVREVKDGKVTPRLKNLSSGDEIEIDGPFGFFRFQPEMFSLKRFLFVATGTGISPFHSFVRTYPELDYQLVHGVRFGNEAYNHEHFSKEKITLCTSGDDTGVFKGRVTDFLKQKAIEPGTHCFLCGNSKMILEVYDILTDKGVEVHNIYTEVYF